MTGNGLAPKTVARDDGSATLWALALVLVLWVSVVGVVLAGIAITARHRAATAADLAALAAASALSASGLSAVSLAPPTSTMALAADPITDPAKACAAAREIAEANRATIASCQVSGGDVEVTATVTIDALRYLGAGAVSARARAGPP